MTTTAPLPFTLAADQHQVPAAQRTTDLLALAQSIADITSPTEVLILNGEDRLWAALLLPELEDADRDQHLLSIITEIHSAEQMEKSDDHNAGDAAQAEKHRASAHGLAEDAVRADLKAAGR